MGLHADLVARRGSFEVDVALDVDDGETLALLGPNGAGKSTVVDALIGTWSWPRARSSSTASGSMALPPGASADRRLLPGRPAVPAALRAGERGVPVARAEGPQGRTLASGPRELLERLAPAVDPTPGRARCRGGSDSASRSRARSYLSRDCSLLDEPFSNVDVSARPGLRALVREVTRTFGGATVLIAHDPLDALTLADRVALLDAGRITQTGTPDEIRAAPSSPYAADLVGVNLFVGELEPLDDGAATLRTPDGEITVSPEVAIASGTRSIASLKPIDVSLHAREPEGSARNVFRGRIVEIADDGDRARVRLATRPPLTAEVTSGSVTRMGLRTGGEVWASFKAVEVSLQIDAADTAQPPAGTLGR